MSSARPPSAPGRGSKGMWLRSKMLVCLGFAAFKDLQVSLEEHVEAEVPLDTQDLWVVPRGQLVTLILGMCMGLGCRMRMTILTMT